MAAFVLVPSASVNGLAHAGERLNLFPGSQTPAVFAAREPFWIGYGFIAEHDAAADSERTGFTEKTWFELYVDGEPISMLTDMRTEVGLPARKTNIAKFPAGLPTGWHDFSGRWYDGGRLILSSRAAIQFVER